MKQTANLPREFELIARYFAPLAREFPGAFGLLDDAAAFISCTTIRRTSSPARRCA